MSSNLLPLYFFLGAVLFVGFGLLFSSFLQTQNSNEQKGTAYECGEESISPAIHGVPFRFYLPALIFLIFEVEIVLLAPVLLSQGNLPENWTSAEWMNLIKTEAIVFVVFLALGYILALKLGYFEWERPTIKPMVFEGPVPDFAYEQFNIEIERKMELNGSVPSPE